MHTETSETRFNFTAQKFLSTNYYFIHHLRDVQDDNFGDKHFNFDVDGYNYSILRIGCYPYIKYHCTKEPWKDFSTENYLYKFITVLNCGLPCLLYGLAAQAFIQHTDYIVDKNTGQKVAIKFLLKELHS